MTFVEADLDPTHDVVLAIREMIVLEQNRASDPETSRPGGDPSDHFGWRSYNPDISTKEHGPELGRPYYDADAWRWFNLVDVALLDGTALVKFRWTEVATPDLEYVVLLPLSRYIEQGSRIAALVARSHLRTLLAPLDVVPNAPTNQVPGWRNRVGRIWLSTSVVVVSQPLWPDYVTASELQVRFDENWA